jgi:hypothetical protein
MGIRCTFYQNRELHKFLDDPLNYEVAKWATPKLFTNQYQKK